ncbi:hypothetical protein BC830DRAFT_1164552 [Chytriomyces sp. MP71]|nr:hypothetical protein BC830DRAFT_1164552 [Chytriomyces sp. MP71]
MGHRNQGYFVRFVCSVASSASYLLFLCGLYLTRLLNSQEIYFHSLPTIDKHYAPPPSNLALIVMTLTVLASILLLLSVGFLSFWQLYYSPATPPPSRASRTTKSTASCARA